MAKQLDASEWRIYFDRVSAALFGRPAEVEIAAVDLGDLIETESIPLIAISYDPKDDIIDVALDGVDHLIRSPRQVFIEQQGVELTSLDIVDADGVHQIVTFKDPMLLPAPKARKRNDQTRWRL